MAKCATAIITDEQGARKGALTSINTFEKLEPKLTSYIQEEHKTTTSD